jgi:FixJ family two-component response regulator
MIEVLVTDIPMPGLNGLDLATLVSEQRPGIGVVFITGNAEGALGRDGEVIAAGALVAKPFTAEALSRAVGRAVDDGRAGFKHDWRKVSVQARSGARKGRKTRASAPLIVTRTAVSGLSPR